MRLIQYQLNGWSFFFWSVIGLDLTGRNIPSAWALWKRRSWLVKSQNAVPSCRLKHTNNVPVIRMIFHPCQMGAWEPVFWLSVGSGCNAFLSVVNQAVVKKKKSPSFLPERVCCHAKSGNSRLARSLCLHNKTAYSKKYIYFFTFQAKARCVHIKGRVREPPCRVVFNAANSITC